MKWTNFVGAAGLLVLVSAVRLQDNFLFQNKEARKVFTKAADKKKN